MLKYTIKHSIKFTLAAVSNYQLQTFLGIVVGQTKDPFVIAASNIIFNCFDLVGNYLFGYSYAIRILLNFKIAQNLVQETKAILKKFKFTSLTNGIAGMIVVLAILLLLSRNGS